MQNENHEHPAETTAEHTPAETVPDTAPAARPEAIRSSQDGPLMNIPAADVVDAGASAAPAAKVDPAEVAVLAQAEDPGVSSRRLRELAMEHPHARPAIAANPAASADLLSWLRGLGDPAVDAALARRRTAR